MKISSSEGKILLKLAKQSISSAFEDGEIDIPKELQKLLSQNQGVFVTLYKNKKLRGCIGFPEPSLPLGVAIIRAARSAAFSDPRFPSLEKDELKAIKMELTILSVPEEVKIKNRKDLPKKIKIGVDGLIVRNGGFSGLLLPQVAPEWGWDAQEFLEHTCEKAGLPHDSWLDRDTKIYTFQGQIFK